MGGHIVIDMGLGDVGDDDIVAIITATGAGGHGGGRRCRQATWGTWGDVVVAVVGRRWGWGPGWMHYPGGDSCLPLLDDAGGWLGVLVLIWWDWTKGD